MVACCLQQQVGDFQPGVQLRAFYVNYLSPIKMGTNPDFSGEAGCVIVFLL